MSVEQVRLGRSCCIGEIQLSFSSVDALRYGTCLVADVRKRLKAGGSAIMSSITQLSQGRISLTMRLPAGQPGLKTLDLIIGNIGWDVFPMNIVRQGDTLVIDQSLLAIGWFDYLLTTLCADETTLSANLRLLPLYHVEDADCGWLRTYCKPIHFGFVDPIVDWWSRLDNLLQLVYSRRSISCATSLYGLPGTEVYKRVTELLSQSMRDAKALGQTVPSWWQSDTHEGARGFGPDGRIGA